MQKAAAYFKEDFAFSKLRERYKKWTGNSFDEKDLISFGLANEQGYLTNAGALVADESPIRWSRLFCTRWNGLNKSGGTIDAFDDAEYSGSVLSLIDNGEAFIKRNAKLMWRETANSREEMPEYVERSYHEALVNALAHRDYLVNGTKSNHIEKIMLLYEGSGKDKISDLTVNLIKGFLCSYTEEFARKYLDKKYIKKFHVEKAYFNYETESFVSKEYELPYITSEKGKKEYVLLTPKDILREDEPAINRKDFLDSYDDVRSMIDNDSLRAYVNNYIAKAILEYENNQKRNKRSVNERSVKKIEKDAFKELAKEYPELYDYYIKYVENNPEQVSKLAHEECTEELEKFYSNSKILIAKVIDEGYVIQEDIEAREEAKNRLKFFKHIIEECDGYLALYYNGKQIAKEKDLQRLFRFVWYGTSYKVDAEPNNGRGQADFIVSKGMNNQNIIEFKLASNSSLGHVFTQIKIYEAANCTDGSLVVIFYFTEEEKRFAEKVIEDSGYKSAIDESIFLIDCRKDNKKSASIA